MKEIRKNASGESDDELSDDEAKELRTSTSKRNSYGSLSRTAWFMLSEVYPFTKGDNESDGSRLQRQAAFRFTGKVDNMRCPDWNGERWAAEKKYIGKLRTVRLSCLCLIDSRADCAIIGHLWLATQESDK